MKLTRVDSSRRGSGTVPAWVALAGIGLAIGIAAPAQKAEFEVASVKPAAPGARGMSCTGGPGTSDPATLTCGNYPLQFLVMKAYDIRPFQLKAPSWMAGVSFDLSARVPPGTGQAEFQAMMQRVLAERFELEAHFESVEESGYDLRISKGGPKLTETTDTQETRRATLWNPPPSGPPRRTKARVARKADSMEDLANFLADQMGKPVRDATGLRGRYDYSLSFLMEPGGRAAEADLNAGPDDGLTLAEAVNQQLGLELKPAKLTTKILVVDRAEKTPKGN